MQFCQEFHSEIISYMFRHSSESENCDMRIKCSGVLVCFFLSTIYNGVSGVALGVLVVVASSHTLGYLFILFLFLLSFSGASTGLAQ
ncbi:uncharacterized protein B0P05DRAFT_563777 [Gilbertella persicaria]|uniref:uncharacterized protein n=1 Tax=Gilbertella persicaria TaxID=101096 RepID=UPI00221EED11|nr:uncharacterized protein B0P05DRAFT_563777 [Gilbertella persicaria]KAI8049111.1 hypothetical protein B0P05DRAFT_563777 [Gilbertella persicaria]